MSYKRIGYLVTTLCCSTYASEPAQSAEILKRLIKGSSTSKQEHFIDFLKSYSDQPVEQKVLQIMAVIHALPSIEGIKDPNLYTCYSDSLSLFVDKQKKGPSTKLSFGAGEYMEHTSFFTAFLKDGKYLTILRSYTKDRSMRILCRLHILKFNLSGEVQENYAVPYIERLELEQEIVDVINS